MILHVRSFDIFSNFTATLSHNSSITARFIIPLFSGGRRESVEWIYPDRQPLARWIMAAVTRHAILDKARPTSVTRLLNAAHKARLSIFLPLSCWPVQPVQWLFEKKKGKKKEKVVAHLWTPYNSRLMIIVEYTRRESPCDHRLSLLFSSLHFHSPSLSHPRSTYRDHRVPSSSMFLPRPPTVSPHSFSLSPSSSSSFFFFFFSFLLPGRPV